MAMEKEKLVGLVTKAQQGDNNAMNELFNAFYNDLYYFALKTVKEEDLALDVTQEAFVEIINTIGKLEEPAAFVTWAKQITYHQCTRYFKKKKDVIVDEDEDGNTVFDTLKEENSEFIPDEALDKDDFKKTILAILNELSEEQRSAVMMYYFDEMSVKQIAEIQGTTEGTVKSRLNYARKAIKASVEEYEKKNGIKLHAIPFLPLLKWVFKGAFDGGLSTASAELVAEGIATATGATITATATTTAATATVTATTTTAVGIGAKIAAIPIATKIIAGIAAVTIAVGGTTTAVILSKDDNNGNDDNNTVITDTDPQYELILDGAYIPEGCVYTMHDGTVLTAGQEFPEKCTAGDWVSYGDYYYGFECIYVNDGGEQKWWLWGEVFDAGDSGMIDSDVYGVWTVMTYDRTKTEYGQIASYVNGRPVTNMYATFYYCDKMTEAPVIPPTITAMTGTFYGCKSLKTAPVIPENVERFMLVFRECTALEGDIVFNAKMDKSLEWFYSEAFTGTTAPLNLVGKTPEEDLILIAKASDNKNITVNGKKVEYTVSDEQKIAMLKSKADFGNKKYALSALSYFTDVNKISPKEIVWFCLYESIIDDIQKYYQSVDEQNNEYFLVPLSIIDEITTKYFGKVYDLSSLFEYFGDDMGTWDARYVPIMNSRDAIEFVLKPNGAGGPDHPEVKDYIKIDDTTYQVNISWYDASSEPPKANETDWYQVEDDPTTYWIAYQFEKMIFKFVDGDWVLKSYSAR